LPSPPDCLGPIVDARHEAAELPRGEERRGAVARGDVEQTVGRTGADQLQRAAGRRLAARVELTAEEPADEGVLVDGGTARLGVAVE
jgi:hypothetical protein